MNQILQNMNQIPANVQKIKRGKLGYLSKKASNYSQNADFTNSWSCFQAF